MHEYPVIPSGTIEDTGYNLAHIDCKTALLSTCEVVRSSHLERLICSHISGVGVILRKTASLANPMLNSWAPTIPHHYDISPPPCLLCNQCIATKPRRFAKPHNSEKPRISAKPHYLRFALLQCGRQGSRDAYNECMLPQIVKPHYEGY